MSEEKWYDNDWLYAIAAGLVYIVTIVGNYYYHGGHLVW